MSIGKAANDNVVPAYGPFPPTQKIAKALGSKYYFTGKPCLRGHIAARYAHSSCTQCKADGREANREKNAADARQWRLDNPEKAAAQGKSARRAEGRKLYYIENREDQIAKALAWNRANPERAKAANDRWWARNPDFAKNAYAAQTPERREQIRAGQREWRAKHRERMAEKSRLWRRANPEKTAASDRTKKAKRKGAEGTHTAADVEAIITRQKSKCAECKVSIKVTGYHVDHIMPLALGGTNWSHNLQILCPDCNMHKHATDPIVFAQRKGRLL